MCVLMSGYGGVAHHLAVETGSRKITAMIRMRWTSCYGCILNSTESRRGIRKINLCGEDVDGVKLWEVDT
jgi:hypothetical protein